MLKRFLMGFLLLSICLGNGLIGLAHAQSAAPVIYVELHGEIDPSQVTLIQRAVKECEEKKAQALIVDMDTFGGLVDSAVIIRDTILDCPVPTVCYVHNRAWSAGALIALSHKHIVISPGGSIGAAEPIPNTEKAIAAVKAEFAATANRTGRDTHMAEAMVDKTLGYPGYAEAGKILALTDYQATKAGLTEAVLSSKQEVLAHYHWEQAPVLDYQKDFGDKLAGWLSDPAVKTGLLSLMFLAIMAEVKTAGMGVGALVALIAAVLFFGGQWLAGMANILAILLFIGGILLLVMELHAPGFGIFGILGIAAIFGSLFITLGANVQGVLMLSGSLLMAIILFLIIAKKLPTSRLWSNLVLRTAETTPEGYTSTKDYSLYLGQQGYTITQLRPAGTMDLNGVRLDVVSEGGFINADTLVVIIEIAGSRIVVRPQEE